MIDARQDRAWFGVRTVIGYKSHFEERIILVSAIDEGSARTRGEEEAIRYAAEMEGWFVALTQVSEAVDTLDDGTEIYSFFRPNTFAPADYAEELDRALTRWAPDTDEDDE